MKQSDENVHNSGKNTRGDGITIMLPLTPYCSFSPKLDALGMKRFVGLLSKYISMQDGSICIKVRIKYITMCSLKYNSHIQSVVPSDLYEGGSFNLL